MIRPALIASWADARLNDVDESFLGGKAAGLLRLPELWVPRFVILTSVFYQSWRVHGSSLTGFKHMSAQEQDWLADLLSGGSGSSSEQHNLLIVRSNAAEESQTWVRGRYRSETSIMSDIESVATAIDEILRSEPSPVSVIVQRQIHPAWRGHMSNARRVSQYSHYWYVESFPPLPSLSKNSRIRASTSRRYGSLTAWSEEKLLGALRTVAGTLKDMDNGRVHCEWVWDGKCVWIVQADWIQKGNATLYVSEYIHSIESLENPSPDQDVLVHFSGVQDGIWKKLARPKQYAELGWPTSDVYLLPGDWWQGESKVQFRNLRRTLAVLCQRPLVIRCDISSDLEFDDLLLKTSMPISDSEEAISFMTHTAYSFRQSGLQPTEWAFLLALLVPARAGVMVDAHPGGQFVRIDATWGFPDGLLFFPHDTYFYYPAEDRVEEKIRYKGQCILPKDGEWVICEISEPEDWESVLSKEEVQQVAQWGTELAKSRSNEVQLMCLVRIGGQRGASACLPWHHTELHIPSYSESKNALVSYRDVEIISTEEDIEWVSLLLSRNRRPRGLVISPEQALIRDRGFICRVARFASEAGLPLFFRGSLLGHAYYLMKQEGPHVIPISPENPHSAIRRYDKLVRDQIPAVVERAGGVARVDSLSRAEARVLLSRKLIEEAFEVWNADAGSLAEEIADVLEVIDSLVEHLGIDADKLAEKQEKKRVARGGFSNLVYLRETEYKSLAESQTEGRLPLFIEDESPPQSRRSLKPERVVFQEKADSTKPPA